MILYIILALVAILIITKIVKYTSRVKELKGAVAQGIAEAGGMATVYEPLVRHMQMTFGCFKVEETGNKLFISNAPAGKSRMFARQTLILNQTMSSVVVTFTSTPDSVSRTWVEPMPIDQEMLWDKIMIIASQH